APRLLQVFDALIGHALAHVRRGVVEASLKARADDGGVRVSGSVRDNGAFYTAEYLAGLFDTKAPVNDATGLAVRLGLALAARSVEAIGGRLGAEANVGAGSRIAFAATLAAAGAGVDEDGPALTEAARSALILVVDDIATIRLVVAALCVLFACSTRYAA